MKPRCDRTNDRTHAACLLVAYETAFRTGPLHMIEAINALYGALHAGIRRERPG